MATDLELEIAKLKAENEELRAGKAPKAPKPPKQAKPPKQLSAAQQASQEAWDRKVAELRIENQLLRSRWIMARELATARSLMQPVLLHIERGRKLVASDRTEIEAEMVRLRDMCLGVSAMVDPGAVASIAGIALSERSERELDYLSRGILACAEGAVPLPGRSGGGPSPLKPITKAKMDRADTNGYTAPGTFEGMPKHGGVAYLWFHWRIASVNLLRAFKYFFFVTGDVPLKTVKLSPELAEVWLHDTIESDATVRHELEKLVSSHGLEREPDLAYALGRIKKVGGWADTTPGEKIDVAKAIIEVTAQAVAIKSASFVELLDPTGNIVGDYSPHENVSRYVGAMAHRKARRVAVANPVPFDVKVLGEWIEWAQ